MNQAMVVTVLEGHVPLQHWDELHRAAQDELQHLPEQMVQTYVLQSHNEPTTWRIVSVWHSQDALGEYQARGATLPGVRIFRAAGVEPVATIWHVAASMHHTTMVE